MLDIFRHFQYNSSMDKDLLIALWAMGAFGLILIFALGYMAYRTRQIEYNHFVAILGDRDLEEEEIKRLFRALKKSKKEPHLLLESEEVMKKVVRLARLNEKEMRVKLGFDTNFLIERFLKKQEELRKVWNARLR